MFTSWAIWTLWPRRSQQNHSCALSSLTCSKCFPKFVCVCLSVPLDARFPNSRCLSFCPIGHSVVGSGQSATGKTVVFSLVLGSGIHKQVGHKVIVSGCVCKRHVLLAFKANDDAVHQKRFQMTFLIIFALWPSDVTIVRVWTCALPRADPNDKRWLI